MGRTAVHLSLFVVFVAVAALGGLGLGAGCSRDAKPAADPARPDEPPPPLPPASGTPIGFLIDDARLTLSDDQRTKLKAIDDELSVKLSYLDSVERNTGSGAPPSKEESSRGGIGFSASGERDGRNAGKRSAPDATGNGVIGGGGPPPGTAADNAAILKRVPEVRAFDVRTAVARALALLAPAQQKIARQVLVDRGVDPDTGRTEAQGQPGSARLDGPP